MPIIWSDSELTLLEALRPVCSTKEIKKVFDHLKYDRTMEGISKKARGLGMYFRDYGEPAYIDLSDEERDAIEEVLTEREEMLSSIEPPEYLTPSDRGKITTLRRETAGCLFRDLQEIREATPRTSSISTKKDTSTKPSLVLLMSDWHVGKIVLDEFNKEIYNIDIGLQRITETPKRLVESIPPCYRDANELVVLLLGDHVDGESIYPGQDVSIEDHVANQVLKTTKATWNMLQEFCGLFPIVRVITTRGNHGRTGLSPEANWDNMLYQHLELLVDMKADPNLTIKNRYGEWNTVDIKGWKGLIRHKAPVQADTAAGRNKFGGWHNYHGYDFMGYGHFHHWGVFTYNSSIILRNGSLPGGDDYAESFGSYDDPTQLVFGVTPNRVVSFVTPIKYGE